MPHQLKFTVLPDLLAVCQLPADAPVPPSLLEGAFFYVSRTSDELSIVCNESRVPEGCRAEKEWLALKLQGPFPFSMTGVLSAFLAPLAQAKITIFAISTFDTDYVLIKRENKERAVSALVADGHEEVRG